MEAVGKGYYYCGLNLPLRLYPLFVTKKVQFLDPRQLAPKVPAEKRQQSSKTLLALPRPTRRQLGQQVKKMGGSVKYHPPDHKHGVMVLCHLRGLNQRIPGEVGTPNKGEDTPETLHPGLQQSHLRGVHQPHSMRPSAFPGLLSPHTHLQWLL